ncbi:hypothetical protein [Nostoc sp.]|uniref:hypothetical protein n=1 Tax=Nostoc sp. TaxID=1180 RepID=UPI0035944D7C
MGEAKRRKKLDPNWAKSGGFSQPNKPKITYLTEEHLDYQKASELKNTFYPDKNFVYLVRLDYEDGDYFVGAVNAFLQGTEITVNAIWSANPNSQRTGLELLQSIRRDIGLKARDDMNQSNVVIDEMNQSNVVIYDMTQSSVVNCE